MDLTSTWQKFKAQPFQLSPKQREFIWKLAQKLKVDPITDEHQLFTRLSTYLKREIIDWSQLTADDVSRAVYILRSQQSPTKTDFKVITEKYPLEIINDILRKANPHSKPITGYDELNHDQVQLILGYKRRFKTQYQDHPIVANLDYEYGWQESPLCADNRMYYLKFYELMMLDYDGITYDELLQMLKPLEDEHYFTIHQTFNGYHVFVMSALLNHRDEASKQLMIQLHCDHYYMMFCYVNGYKIRLSRKIGRDETCVSKEVGNFGNSAKINADCQKLLAIFLGYLKSDY